MARARNIKPGFFKNEDLAELGMESMLLFEGLWVLADRAGRLEDRPRRIKAEVFPYFDVDVDALLAGLDASGFIVRYVCGGVGYIQVTNFGKHQTPHIKEAASTIPAPDMHGANTVLAPPDSLIPDSHDSLIADTGLLGDAPAAPKPKRAHAIASWTPTGDDREWAYANGFTEADVNRQVPVFLDHYQGNGKPMKDWPATFRNWMRRSRDDARFASTRASPHVSKPTAVDLLSEAGKRVQERHDERGRNQPSPRNDQHPLLADGKHGEPQRRFDGRDVDAGAVGYPIDAVYRERS